jgi:hypothetical protein
MLLPALSRIVRIVTSYATQRREEMGTDMICEPLFSWGFFWLIRFLYPNMTGMQIFLLVLFLFIISITIMPRFFYVIVPRFSMLLCHVFPIARTTTQKAIHTAQSDG